MPTGHQQKGVDVTAVAQVENRAQLSRATCGWRRAGLDLADVWSYWRDVHSPAIARRAGILVYRQFQWAPVRSEFLGTVDGVATSPPADQQLQWTSDIIYESEAALSAFYSSPPTPELMSRILADIDLIVDKSTTYLTVGDNMTTLADATGDPTPQGPPRHPHYGVFLRARTDRAEAFRPAVATMAARWAGLAGVRRVRYNLFEPPDMEADSRAGYPVKTHPVEMQYQAWVEIVAEDEAVGRQLLAGSADVGCLAAAEAYPVAAVYSFVWDSRPTVVGLRGFPAHRAIEALGAGHATDHGLLEWMYGSVVDGADRTEAR